MATQDHDKFKIRIHRQKLHPENGAASCRVTLSIRPFRVACACSLCANLTLSMKPEVHNVSQRRQRRIKPRTTAACVGYVVVCEICEGTDRETESRHAHRNTKSQKTSASNTSSFHLDTKFSQPPNLHICMTSSQFSLLAALALHLWSH